MKATYHEEKVLTAAECDDIITLFDRDHGHGRAYGEGTEYISKRTTIVTLPEAVHRKIHAAVKRANKRLWGYEGDYLREHELYRYQPGDFFDWHMDLGDGSLAHRKVTTLVQLSPAKDYDGGLLQIWGNEEHTASRRRGTLLVYPSYVMHRVTDITRGVRYSLGGEIVGPPFR